MDFQHGMLMLEASGKCSHHTGNGFNHRIELGKINLAPDIILVQIIIDPNAR